MLVKDFTITTLVHDMLFKTENHTYTSPEHADQDSNVKRVFYSNYSTVPCIQFYGVYERLHCTYNSPVQRLIQSRLKLHHTYTIVHLC